MKLDKGILAAGLVAALGLGTAAAALAHSPGGSCTGQACGWHQGWHWGPMMEGYGMGPGMMGPGMMGPGMMGPGPGYGMGPGMMGPGTMGPGMMGPDQGWMQPLRQDLSVDDVRHIMAHRLAWSGNPNLRLGDVEAKDDDTVVVEIVTRDGSPVQTLEVDRHTGRTTPAR